jgi:hypothetical protein
MYRKDIVKLQKLFRHTFFGRTSNRFDGDVVRSKLLTYHSFGIWVIATCEFFIYQRQPYFRVVALYTASRSKYTKTVHDVILRVDVKDNRSYSRLKGEVRYLYHDMQLITNERMYEYLLNLIDMGIIVCERVPTGLLS